MAKTPLILSLLLVVACDGPLTPTDSGTPHTPDASPPVADAGLPPRDAGLPPRDAGRPKDAGPDAADPPDAAPPPVGGGPAEPDQDAGEEPPSGGSGGDEAGADASGQGGAGMGGAGDSSGESGSGGGQGGIGGTGGGEPPPQIRVLRENLNFPWEIVWGPDDYLWVTERTSFQVSRIDPSTGSQNVALELQDGYQVGGQDGLLGMALHPELLQNTGNDYVYISYTYNAADSAAAPDRRQKIVRYTYNTTTEQLENPLPLILGLPASLDHNAGRLAYGPDGKLYYTIGDQGANQYDRACQLNRAQTLPTASLDLANYPGKTLRINPEDGSVPSDNPVLNGVRSHVFTYGHRNHQGLSFTADGRLFESEHGAKSDDEINLIVAGQNYGWPWISGYQDDRAYEYREWASSSVPCEDLTYNDYSVPPSVPTQTETSISSTGLTPPITTMFTVDSDFMFLDPDCATVGSFLCWPTIAPSSLHAYEGPLWPPSLLIPSLKHGLIYRLPVSDSNVEPLVPMTETTTQNRYRDIAVTPDGTTIYVVTDVVGASYVSRGASFDIANPGAILEFRY